MGEGKYVIHSRYHYQQYIWQPVFTAHHQRDAVVGGSVGGVLLFVVVIGVVLRQIYKHKQTGRPLIPTMDCCCCGLKVNVRQPPLCDHEMQIEQGHALVIHHPHLEPPPIPLQHFDLDNFRFPAEHLTSFIGESFTVL